MNWEIKIYNKHGKLVPCDALKYPDLTMAMAYLGGGLFRKIQEDFPSATTVFLTLKGEAIDQPAITHER